MIRKLASAMALAILASSVAAQDASTQETTTPEPMDEATTSEGMSDGMQDVAPQDTMTQGAMAQDPMAQDPLAQDSTQSVASASAVNGPVQVNQGEQFLPLQSGQPLRAGDRVMAMRDGSATLTFQDGCTLSIAPETMVVVPATSTCAGGVASAQAITESTEAVGSASYAGETTTMSNQTGAQGVDWGGFGVVAGAAVIGAAVLYASDDDDEDDDDTVSP